MGSISDFEIAPPPPPAYPNVILETNRTMRIAGRRARAVCTLSSCRPCSISLWDAAPAVSAAGVKAIMSVGLETAHPIIQMVTKTGSHAETRDSVHIAGVLLLHESDLIGHSALLRKSPWMTSRR